jgi:esterase
MTASERHGHVMLGGLAFHYVEWGSPEGPVLVALHGLRSYAETFAELAAELPDVRVIALDQRGRGRSDWDPDHRYETFTYVADLTAFVDALELAQFHLLGHSMGGANAIVYAGRQPGRVTSLIVEEMAPGAAASSDGSERIARELASTPMAFRDRASALRFWRSIRPNVTDAAIASRMRYTLNEAPDGSLGWRYDAAGIAAARARFAPVDLTPSVSALGMPVLLVRGADSSYVTAELATAMALQAPQMECVSVPAAGHYVHDDAPAPFAAAVRAFLARSGAVIAE